MLFDFLIQTWNLVAVDFFFTKISPGFNFVDRRIFKILQRQNFEDRRKFREIGKNQSL